MYIEQAAKAVINIKCSDKWFFRDDELMVMNAAVINNTGDDTQCLDNSHKSPQFSSR